MVVLEQDGYLERKGSFPFEGYLHEDWYCHRCKCKFSFKWSSPDPTLYRIIHEIVPDFGHKMIRIRRM